MNEPPGARMRVGLSALTVAELCFHVFSAFCCEFRYALQVGYFGACFMTGLLAHPSVRGPQIASRSLAPPSVRKFPLKQASLLLRKAGLNRDFA
jgi:hypothetical protein